MRRILTLAVATTLLCPGAAQHAAAEPIQILAGTLSIPGRFAVGAIDVSGTRGFALESRVDTGEGSVAECARCLAGLFGFGGLLPEPAFPGGIATFEDRTFDDMGEVDSPTAITLAFSGSVDVPEIRSPSTLMAPFLLDGFFFDPSVGAVPIVGGGTATLFVSPGPVLEGRQSWILGTIQYDFSADSTPIPEPGTLLLTGTGIVAGWRIRRRRREFGLRLSLHRGPLAK